MSPIQKQVDVKQDFWQSTLSLQGSRRNSPILWLFFHTNTHTHTHPMPAHWMTSRIVSFQTLASLKFQVQVKMTDYKTNSSHFTRVYLNVKSGVVELTLIPDAVCYLCQNEKELFQHSFHYNKAFNTKFNSHTIHFTILQNRPYHYSA